MAIRNRDILQSLPLLGSALGNQYGVTVTIGGNGAYCHGTTINIPALPATDDGTLLPLVRGFIDHEAAHIRYTDNKVWMRAKMDAVTAHVVNSIEDWRIEQKMAEIYPGCREHFRWLISNYGFKDADVEAGDTTPAFLVMRYVLAAVRHWDAPEISHIHAGVRSRMEARYPGLASDIDAVLARVHANCPDTQASVDYGREIVDCIRKWKAPPHEQPQTSSVDSDSPDGDNMASHQKADTAQAQGPEQELQDMLECSEGALPKAIGEQLAEELVIESGKNGEKAVAVAQIGQKHLQVLDNKELQAAMRSSAALRHRLQGVLQAQALKRCAVGRRGKLDTRILHHMSVGNPRVFRRDTTQKELNTAVHILLDTSGSMRGDIELARQAAFACAKSLEQIRSVNLGVTGFPCRRPDNGVYPLVAHGQRVGLSFSMDAGGTTPLAEAIWWTLQQLVPLREERKILLVLTDGIPDDSEAALQAISEARRLGIEVFGIGIGYSRVSEFFPEHNCTVNMIDDLAPAMFTMLQRALLSGGSHAQAS